MTKITTEDKYNTWMHMTWRPCVAWAYLLICVFDFVIAPVLFTYLQFHLGQPLAQWEPLTLKGAGLIHMAFGAVIGITAWGRTQEKIMSQGETKT